MRDLLILGTGVHELEMSDIVARVNRIAPTWNLLGFLSPDASQTGSALAGLPVLGGSDAASAFDADLLPGNSWPYSPALAPTRLATLIDPSAFVASSAQIGAGCVIYPNCFVGHNARLGERVFALSGCIINHDDILEDQVVLASQVSLAGCVHVEAGCYLGQACSVRQYVTIGHGSLVGMGSVVIKDVPPGMVVVGNPARVLRPR